MPCQHPLLSLLPVLGILAVSACGQLAPASDAVDPEPRVPCSYSVEAVIVTEDVAQQPGLNTSCLLRSAGLVAWGQAQAWWGGTAAGSVASRVVFKVEHHAVAGCPPVTFESEGLLATFLRVLIHGAGGDQATAVVIQTAVGMILPALNNAAAIQVRGGGGPTSATINVPGPAGTSLSIPVTPPQTDTCDAVKRQDYRRRVDQSEVEIITGTLNATLRTSSGAYAYAFADESSASLLTVSTCPVHHTRGAQQWTDLRTIHAVPPSMSGIPSATCPR